MSTEKKTYTMAGEFFLLLAKYGKDSFIDMAERIECKEIDHAMKIMTEKLKQTKNKAGVKNHTINRIESSKAKKHDELDSLSNDKIMAINNIYYLLSSSYTFKNKKDLEAYVTRQNFVGRELLNLRTKKTIIDSFIKSITQLGIDKLAIINADLKKAQEQSIEKNDDRSLENWSNIIFKSKEGKE